MIDLRWAAGWAQVPMEILAALPPTALDELTERINRRDRWIVQDRGS